MKPALQQYVEDLVGGQFTVQITMPTIGTVPTKVVGNNFERMALTIINTGSVSLLLSPLVSVAAAQGIILGAAGGSLSVNARDDLILPGWEWWGLGSGGTPTTLVIEVLRYNATPASSALAPAASSATGLA